ncbi:Calcineurin-like metallo-phosphoesterase superfamily protein isoform 1 [Hibiscus syriacus]|uniref:RING-type E3 ubiquitin transferase n=1 Tax=Hibiscus syriacus TaxID=106335 RepID=A0A6A2X906_HIBSY|nr:uncharacterized RING finger protein C57A7.09-like [Hibiscus syriacus]KAE8671893.1 Calcineurin-like metallo-phosphoesterase superfamily protein isoform 1 [Hibiscus syriacus]
MSYYQCEAWQIEGEDDGEHDPSLCPVFLIEIFANIVCHNTTTVQRLFLPQDELTQAGTSWSAICSKLSQMGVPFSLHATVMHKIIECARSAMTETRNKKRKNIPIIVTLGPERWASEEDEEARGASMGAIGSLKDVEVDGNMQCAICLEEISDGFEANQMPCSHVYHQLCILSWLEKSNLCPLCRFQMPT